MYSEKLLINHLSVELGLGLQTRTDIRLSIEDISDSDSDSDIGPQTKKTTRDELGTSMDFKELLPTRSFEDL